MTYVSNMQSVVKKLEKTLLSAVQSDKLLREIATTLQASNIRRIHNDGKAVNLQFIGNYDSHTPLYVNPKRSPRKFTPKGKTGKTTFADGKKHKTKYFAQGYKGFRDEIGRPTEKVNLQLSGKLLKDFKIEKNGNGYDVGFETRYGSEIRRGQEEKWGKKIWGVTKIDKNNINRIVTQFIKKETGAKS